MQFIGLRLLYRRAIIVDWRINLRNFAKKAGEEGGNYQSDLTYRNESERSRRLREAKNERQNFLIGRP